MLEKRDGEGRFRNVLLARLSAQEQQVLAPRFELVNLRFRQRLETVGRICTDVYFPETGIVSLVARSRHEQAEAAIIGAEGMTGHSVLLGIDRSPYDALVQVPNSTALRISAADLKDVLELHPNLRATLLRFVQVICVQLLHAVVTATRGTIEQRLARWLLMAHDRMGGETLLLTHELLAATLSVRRAGVTQTLGRLSLLGLIAHERGQIRILDRSGLVHLAGAFYGEPEAEYARQFPEG